MGALDVLGQLLLPGIRRLTGAERIAGKPGWWAVEPTKLSDASFLQRGIEQLGHEAELARAPGGMPSISGAQAARHADMTQGALETLRDAHNKYLRNPNARGVVVVSPGGNIQAASAIDTAKAADYLGKLGDLDFTKRTPNYLDFVGTVSPQVRGRDLLHTTQELYGDPLVFQVFNPRKNVGVYESMGAKRMPLLPNGEDALEGHAGLPAFQIEQRIPRTAATVENADQLRLPGFAGGGSVMDGPSAADMLSNVGYQAVKGGLEALNDPINLASLVLRGPLGLAAGLLGSSDAQAINFRRLKPAGVLATGTAEELAPYGIRSLPDDKTLYSTIMGSRTVQGARTPDGGYHTVGGGPINLPIFQALQDEAVKLGLPKFSGQR